jgi:hypothetical protein
MNHQCTVPGCRFIAEYMVEMNGDGQSHYVCGIHWVPWTIKNAHLVQHCTITALFSQN